MIDWATLTPITLTFIIAIFGLLSGDHPRSKKVAVILAILFWVASLYKAQSTSNSNVDLRKSIDECNERLVFDKNAWPFNGGCSFVTYGPNGLQNNVVSLGGERFEIIDLKVLSDNWATLVHEVTFRFDYKSIRTSSPKIYNSGTTATIDARQVHNLTRIRSIQLYPGEESRDLAYIVIGRSQGEVQIAIGFVPKQAFEPEQLSN